MKHNIITGEGPDALKNPKWTMIDGTTPPTEAQLQAAGWRDMPPEPELAAGFVRVSKTFAEGDGVTGAWEVVDQLQTELDAEAAAAEAQAEYQASLPVPMPTGIEAPVVVLTDADGKGWGVVADGGDLVTYPDHASPRPDAATIAARIAAARAEGQTRRARLLAIEIDLLTIDTAVDEMMAVDLSATGSIGVAIAATTGVNKAALTALRNALIDVRAKAKKGLNNARQAAEKLRKEVK
jgi:hypothetical protein